MQRLLRPSIRRTAGGEEHQLLPREGWSTSAGFVALGNLCSAVDEPCRGRADQNLHTTSTVAPTSSNFFFASSASSLETPLFTVRGRLSTASLASFRPRPVSSRTTLMT